MTKFLVFISNPEMYDAGTPVGKLLDLEDYDSNEELWEAAFEVAGENFEATAYTLPFPFDPQRLSLETVLEKIDAYKTLLRWYEQSAVDAAIQDMGDTWNDYYYTICEPASTLRELGELFTNEDNDLSRYLTDDGWKHYIKENGFKAISLSDVGGSGYIAYSVR